MASADTSSSRKRGSTSSRRSQRTSVSKDGSAAQKRRSIPFKRIAIIVVAIVVIIGAFNVCSNAMGVQVMINGNQYTIRGEKTVTTAAKECGIPLNPGDLISIRGNVLQRHEGEPFSATVNGNEVTDYNQRLHDGDVVMLGDGKDIVEEYESYLVYTDHSAVSAGTGAIRVFTREGSDGVIEVRTGSLSGEVVEKLKAEPIDLVCTNYNPDVGDDKVIALTFDDGPSEEYTSAILDVLAANDVKATFFVVGTQVEKGKGAELVRRAAEEGHLVCTHTFSHANATGNTANIANLAAEDQRGQVEKGIQSITDALNGGEQEEEKQESQPLFGIFGQKKEEPEPVEVSHIVRLPGGISDKDVMLNVHDLVEAEIGWNLDTGDWVEPGTDAIVEVLLSAEPGDIVLMHDGGGDRSQTVEALRKALPQLVKRGYSFITIEELLEYPAMTR